VLDSANCMPLMESIDCKQSFSVHVVECCTGTCLAPNLLVQRGRHQVEHTGALASGQGS
jgi:hypothetical protein